MTDRPECRPLNDVTARNQQQSPLLRLPAEPRNKAFAYACDTLIIIQDYSEDGLDGMFTKVTESGAGLLRVCQQMRSEAAAFVGPYTHLSFEIETYWFGFSNGLPAVKYHNIQSVTFKGLIEAEDVFRTVVGDADLDEDGTLFQCIKSHKPAGNIVAPACPSIKTIYLDCKVDDSLLLTVMREVKSAARQILNRQIDCSFTKRALEDEVQCFGGSKIA